MTRRKKTETADTEAKPDPEVEPEAEVVGREAVFVGDEHRDATHDPDFEAPEGTLPQHEAFEFDFDKDAHRVDHLAVAWTHSGLLLEIDGAYYAIDTQLAAGLRRLVQAAVINLNL